MVVFSDVDISKRWVVRCSFGSAGWMEARDSSRFGTVN